MSLLGNRVVRTEDPKFLTGASRYVGDIDLPGLAHVVFVKAVMAHANIVGVDISEAVSMPGVIKIFTAADLDGLNPMASMAGIDELRQELLATTKVRYVGEPIVAIVAETVAQGTDAAEAVFVDYDPLPAVPSIERSIQGDSLLFESRENNVCGGIPPMPAGKIDFSDCEVVVTEVVQNQRVAPASLEPRVGAADWTGDRLNVWASCQGAGAWKGGLMGTYGFEGPELVVFCPDVGGGFGAKAGPGPEESLLPYLSKQTGRPVRWAETRSENMTGMSHGRAQRQTVKIGGTKDGDITHYSLHVDADAGAYANAGAMLPGLTMLMLSGTYVIPNVQFTSQALLTNSTPIGAFRGAGRPEATAAVERAVDLFAAEIGMDPADVRAKNLLARFEEPHTTATGAKYDVGDFPAALEKALEAAGYADLRAEQARRRAAGDRKALGIGVSSYVEITSLGGPDGSSEFGSVELQADGSVLALTGSTPHGQGHVTAWQMVIADELGIDMDRITVEFGDTDRIPSMSMTGGSRSAQVAGSAMKDASERLVSAARATAARLLEANEDDITLDQDTGRFHVVGTPAVSVGWEDVASAQPESPLLGIAEFVQPGSSFPFGAHCSVVEVDLDTGLVELLRHIAVDDCGTILNPLLVDGQVHGGLAQGIAQALMEEVRYDDDGNPMTSNFADYSIISATELPSFERVEMVTPSPLNPLGAKGIGESATIGSTPAVQNAVVDALGHLGVRHIDMPCTPEKVWRTIVAAGA